MRINRIENELDIIDAGLITENPTSVLSAFLSTHAWIVDVLMLVFVVSGVYRCYKTKKQDSDEKDIKNMFNEDGTKNQHYAHKCIVTSRVRFDRIHIVFLNSGL